MEPDKLVKMANQIGAFFEADPDPARVEAGIVDHLRRFWDPRMRRELIGWLDDHDGAGLRPAVRAALVAQRAKLC